MSWFCIYEKEYAGSLYDPPERWCSLGLECDAFCPHRWSQEDYDFYEADDELDEWD